MGKHPVTRAVLLTTVLCLAPWVARPAGPAGSILIVTTGTRGELPGRDTLEALREETPVLLVDVGAFHAYPGVGEARQAWDALAAMGCDVTTPGEQELGLGLAELEAVYRRRPEVRVVCANLFRSRGHREWLWPPSVVLEKGTLRVGVTGISYPPRWSRNPQDYWALHAEASMDSLRAVVRELSKQTDLIVLLVSGSMPSTESILEDLPEVDVVVGRVPRQEGRVILRPTGGRVGAVRMSVEGGHVTSEPLAPIRLREPPPRERETYPASEELTHAGRLLGIVGRPRLSIEPVWDGASIHGVLSDDRGGRLEFAWNRRATTSSVWSPLPVHLPELHRDMALGSTEEDALITLLRGIADRFFDRDARDRLLSLPPAEPRFSSRAEADAFTGLRLAEFLDSQRRQAALGPPPYWERRRVVYLDLSCARDGNVRQARVLENNAWSSAADSLAREARSWRLPPHPQDRDRHVGTAHRVVGIPHDRTASGAGMGEVGRLPAVLRDTLRTGSLRSWMEALQAVDPDVSVDDFLNGTGETLRLLDPKPPVDGERIRLHERMGLLHRAYPETTSWVLDPFADLTAAEGGDMPDTASARALVFRPSLDGYVAYYELRALAFDQGAWVDWDVFVLVGWSTVSHPRFPSGAWSTLKVPAVWIGDIDEEVVHVFLGSPLHPTREKELHEALRGARRTSYPAAFLVR